MPSELWKVQLKISWKVWKKLAENKKKKSALLEETQEKLVKISFNSAEFSLKLANTKAKKFVKIQLKSAKNQLKISTLRSHF